VADALPAGLGLLMADQSIPDAARVIGYHIATHDTGEGVELRLGTVSALLHGWPGDDKARSALRILRLAGYATSTPGGRDHGDVYRWAGGNRVGLEPHPKDRVGLEPQAKSDLGWGSTPTLSDSMGLEPQAKAPPPPPYTSTTSSVDARAREAMDQHEDLRGLRGALGDYFKLGRVPNQHAYTMTVLGWLQGTDPSVWLDPRSGQSLSDGRQAVIAGCLNDLANCDEIGTYFPGAPGDAGNLRAKIRYKVRSILGAQRDALRNGTTPGTPPKARRTREVYIEQ